MPGVMLRLLFATPSHPTAAIHLFLVPWPWAGLMGNTMSGLRKRGGRVHPTGAWLRDDRPLCAWIQALTRRQPPQEHLHLPCISLPRV